MPVKIGFQVIASTGEDEKFRSNELNYHGPTVRGWRSSANCSFPQEIIIQLKVFAILHQIQILSHQYLIPQKIEICTSSRFDYDSLPEDSSDLFEYLGFITFSDNTATGFRSRELKSIQIPSKTAKYIKLRIHSNHANVKNLFNQVGLMAINILGDEVHFKTEESELNNNVYYHSNASFTTAYRSPHISPYDDLAFEMYVDQETARIMKMIEFKKHQAVCRERFEYAKTLKTTLENLRVAGEILGLYEQEKKQAINVEDYDKAKAKKLQMENFRQKVYGALHINQLLESTNSLGENDFNSNIEERGDSSDEEDISDEHSPLPEDRFDERLPKTSPNGFLADNVNGSDHDNEFRRDKSPLPSLRQPLQKEGRSSSNQLTSSKSQTSFSERKRIISQDLHAFSTSMSNPQLHQYLRETRSTTPGSRWPSNYYSEKISPPSSEQPSPELNKNADNVPEALERVRTPSSASSSAPDEISAPKSYEKFTFPVQNLKLESIRNLNVSLIPQLGIRIPEKSSSQNASKHSPNQKSETSVGKSKLKMSSMDPLQASNKAATATNVMKSSFEAYEERMLPALRSYQGHEVVRECQFAFDQSTKSTLNERDKKQAMLPISIFGIEMIEKFYSKNFSDKEEGLKQLQQELKRISGDENIGTKQPSFNKVARATIFLLHRALRDKVFSVYSSAAETVRLFFTEFVPQRVSQSEVARSVEKLLPELLTKSGDATPRIHNMAAHTLLSMAECEEVRNLNIIPAHLSRPLTSSVHPRLALSRLEMVEQLILNHGISRDKRSGLTCRTLAEFGSSGLHHPTEAVRKVSERILIQVYKVNPRIVRKQLPPDDNVTRRNLLFRQLFQEFDFMDMQRKINERTTDKSPVANGIIYKTLTTSNYENHHNDTISRSLSGDKYSISNVQEELKTRSINIPNLNHNPKTNFLSTSLRETDKTKASDSKTQMRNADRSTDHSTNHSKQELTFETCDNFKKTPPKEKRKDKTENHFSSPLKLANQKNNFLEKGSVNVKFPLLADSLQTPKLKLMFDESRSLKPPKVQYILGKDQNGHAFGNNERKSNNVALPRKDNKRDGCAYSSVSSIPIPTFGSSRNHLMNSLKKIDKGTKLECTTKVSKEKQKDGIQRFKPLKSLKISIPDTVEGGKRVVKSVIKKEVFEKSSNKKEVPCKKQSPGEECNRFSESMLESLKESIYQANGQDERQGTLKKCIFCLSSKNLTTEDGLNNHYLKDCPMLTTCQYCREVTEISGFTNHLLVDCNQKHLFQKCNQCQEAILKDSYTNHKCTASANKSHKSSCPFCHLDIGDEDDSWRKHFMGNNVCQKHPRQKRNDLPPQTNSIKKSID